jgi:hypothetical protein
MTEKNILQFKNNKTPLSTEMINPIEINIKLTKEEIEKAKQLLETQKCINSKIFQIYPKTSDKKEIHKERNSQLLALTEALSSISSYLLNKQSTPESSISDLRKAVFNQLARNAQANSPNKQFYINLFKTINIYENTMLNKMIENKYTEKDAKKEIFKMWRNFFADYFAEHPEILEGIKIPEVSSHSIINGIINAIENRSGYSIEQKIIETYQKPL